MKGKHWIKRFGPTASGERYVVRSTEGPNGEWGVAIDFWHVTPEHTYLYTFLQNHKYRHRATWDEALFKDLAAEVHSQKPQIAVFRFAVDDLLIFSDGSNRIPKAPPAYSQAEKNRMEKLARRAAHEELLAQQEAAKQKKQEQRAEKARMSKRGPADPAPYVLYGHHIGREKEYSWRLYPELIGPEGVVAGDKVIAWSKNNWVVIEVTRIEEAGDRPQPTSYVKRKITPSAEETPA